MTTAVNGAGSTQPAQAPAHDPHYKWIALSNTTLGMLIATINSSIVLIALPDIFKGINLNPLLPENTSYLLWMMMGFLVVTAVLVVSFGRLGDMFGRARMYNMGFAIFTVSSILLAITWFDGSEAAIWLIFCRGRRRRCVLDFHHQHLPTTPRRPVPPGPRRGRLCRASPHLRAAAPRRSPRRRRTGRRYE